MRRTNLLLACIAALAFAPGCIVVHDHGGGGGGNVQPVPQNEPLVQLGPQNYPGYHVLANANATLPGGDLGYIVTANGQGGYRVTWTDTNGSAAHFSGTITVDGVIDSNPQNTHGFSGNENLTFTGENQISFDSVPGTGVDGVDLVSSTDPIYLSASIDGYTDPGQVHIYFVGATTQLNNVSSVDPVAFTSP